jgi:hypothetical protein
VVVSRSSLGRLALRSGSSRSRRVARSPTERAKAVKPAGPPITERTRLPAVLSLDRRRAEIAKRHAAFGDVRLGHRRIFQEIAVPIGDKPIEPLPAFIHPFQHGRRRKRLERAAHRKALAGAMLEPRASSCVYDRDAEPSALAPLYPGQALVSLSQGLVRRRCPLERVGRRRPKLRGQRETNGVQWMLSPGLRMALHSTWLYRTTP